MICLISVKREWNLVTDSHVIELACARLNCACTRVEPPECACCIHVCCDFDSECYARDYAKIINKDKC